MSTDPKRPLAILNAQPGDLAYVLMKAGTLNALQDAFASLLEPLLAKNCLVANTENATLTVLVNNGTTATHLRMLVPELLAQFKQHPTLKAYTQLVIKVRPPLAPSQKRASEPKGRACRPLSAASAQQLCDTAAGIEDEGLRAALLKLAKNRT